MLATARAKFYYAAQQADELSLAPGSLVTITGVLYRETVVLCQVVMSGRDSQVVIVMDMRAYVVQACEAAIRS